MEISQLQGYLIFQNLVSYKLLIWVQISTVRRHFAMMRQPNKNYKGQAELVMLDQDLETARIP